MRRHFLLFVLVSITCNFIIAQPYAFGFRLGAGPTKYSTIEFMAGKNKSLFSLGADIDFESFQQKGTTNHDIGWDELPQDHIKDGSYLSFIQFGYKYIVSQKLIVGIQTGVGKKVLYRNCFDETKELGDNGKYSKQKYVGKTKADLALSINYCKPLNNKHPNNTSIAMFGVNLGLKTGMIFTIGFLLDTRNYEYNSN